MKIAFEPARTDGRCIILTGTSFRWESAWSRRATLILVGTLPVDLWFPRPKWWKQRSGPFETIQLNCNLFPIEAFSETSFDEQKAFRFEDMDLCSDLRSARAWIPH